MVDIVHSGTQLVDIVHRAPESLCYVDHCKCSYKCWLHIFPTLDNISGVILERGLVDPFNPSLIGLSKFQPFSPDGSNTFSMSYGLQLNEQKGAFSLFTFLVFSPPGNVPRMSVSL